MFDFWGFNKLILLVFFINNFFLLVKIVFKSKVLRRLQIQLRWLSLEILSLEN